jgi:acyl-CoA reductase-like NAD-dependent aldehyde dehydrogenase
VHSPSGQSGLLLAPGTGRAVRQDAVQLGTRADAELGEDLAQDPAPRLKIVAEEQFGPALPVIPYDSEAEAVALANQTWSGLCSSVWSADTEHAMKIAGQLRTGVTFFNNHNATAVDERAPFGGFNASGIGRELGRPGLYEFTETHVMAVPSGG